VASPSTQSPKPIHSRSRYVGNLKALKPRCLIKLPTTARRASIIAEVAVRRSGDESLEVDLRKRLRPSLLLATHDADGRHYQICPLCGAAYEYDGTMMRRTRRLVVRSSTINMSAITSGGG